MSPAARRSVPWRALALLLLATCALRLLVVLAPPADLFERGTMPQEECLRGIAAWEILRGPLVPLQDYQINHFWGGSLVVSLMAVPLFALFGPKAFALRLVSLPFALGAVLLVFVWLDRFASRRAAWIGACLLAFAPPGYALVGSTVYGTHLESNALALGLSYLWFEWRAHSRGGARRTFLFGLASGFSVWFGYGLLLVLATAAAFEVAADALFFARRAFRPWIAGFAVGFAPWITYGLQRGFSAMKIYDTTLTGHFVIGLVQGTAIDLEGRVRVSPLEKLYDLFARDLPESLWFLRAPGVEALWVDRAVFLVLATLAAFAAWSARQELAALVRALLRRSKAAPVASPAAFAIVFLAIFVVAWCASDFAIGPRHWVQNFRYMMPPVPFALALAALGADRAVALGGAARAAAIAAVAGVVVACALATAARARPRLAREHLALEANSLEWNARFLLLRFGDDPRAMAAIVERIERRRDEPERERLIAAVTLGAELLANRAPSGDPEVDARRAGYRATAEFLRKRSSSKPADDGR